LKILALDTGYNTGFAVGYGQPDNTIIGTVKFHYAKDDAAELGAEFSRWLSKMLTEHEPNIVACERPFLRGKASWSLMGLVWEVHRCAQARDLQRIEYAPMQIKKFACGTVKASKADMEAWARRCGFDISTDHEADAVAILKMASAK
jgi:Holliday junction resolvasome RuvABC endonuclease subunit